jgi:hypothetical protein
MSQNNSSSTPVTMPGSPVNGAIADQCNEGMDGIETRNIGDISPPLDEIVSIQGLSLATEQGAASAGPDTVIE